MDHAPVVQVLLDDKVVAEVPFSGEVLRVGRMRENDLVLPNLSVSRFHAVLHRDGGALRVEDLGSENGCLLNGERVQGSAPFAHGDELRIVRHVLRLRSDAEDEDDDAELPGLRADDRSAAQASLDTAPLRAMGAAAPPAETVVDLGAEEGDAAPAPADLPSDAPPEEEARSDGNAAPPGGLFDFSMDEDLARSDPALAFPMAPEPPETTGPDAPPEPAADPAPDGGAETPVYAGLIIQRGGQLEHVLAWEGDRLCAGRASSCEIPLGSPRISRRHALFVREAGRFEVRDLDSVGGVFVNGERVLSHSLVVGDVVRIDEFELTFLLDQQPVGEAVRTHSLEDGAELPGAGAPTQLGEAGANTDEATMPPNGMADTAAAADAAFRELDLVDEVEAAGVGDDEKELEVAVSSQPSPPAPVPVASEASGSLVLEVRLDAAKVPEAVRQWLEKGDGTIRLPVELRLRSQGDAGDASRESSGSDG